MKAKITEDDVILGDHSIVNKTSAELKNFLNSVVFREILLENGANLVIFDSLGIRYWEKNDRVRELQFCFEVYNEEIFPVSKFTNSITFEENVLTPPISSHDIPKVPFFSKFNKDDDSARFGMDVNEFLLDKLKFWYEKKNNLMISFSVTFK